MNLITIKDYAKQNRITYEAVRQQVNRYKKELEGHIIKDGRQQFLDEEAVLFLDGKREKNPVAIIQQDKDDTIKQLEQENKTLLQRIAILQEDLLKAKDVQIQIQGEIAEQKMLAAKTVEVEKALEEMEQRATAAESAATALMAESDQLRAELEAYKALPWYKKIFSK